MVLLGQGASEAPWPPRALGSPGSWKVCRLLEVLGDLGLLGAPGTLELLGTPRTFGAPELLRSPRLGGPETPLGFWDSSTSGGSWGSKTARKSRGSGGLWVSWSGSSSLAAWGFWSSGMRDYKALFSSISHCTCACRISFSDFRAI